MNRRDFLLATLASSSLISLPSWARNQHNFSLPASPDFPSYAEMAPLERLSHFGGSSTIEGDTHDEAHEIFWDKDGYVKKKGGIPAASEEYDVIIVGGGLAGLSAAYYLNGKKILLIEGNPRLGGNAKAQVYQNSYVSQGSAYVTIPESGGEIDRFFTNLNLKNKFRKVNHLEEAVTLGGKPITNFWEGGSAPEKAEAFKEAHELFANIYENKYPELPIWDDSTTARAHFNSLDGMTFASWIQCELGSSHPHVLEFINLYCWSSFSAGTQDISAAQGLNFLASDLAGTQVLPGGNGLISQALFENLRKRPGVTLLSNSFAVDIVPEGGKAIVCYKDSSNKLITARASHCVVASAKMVAKKIIRDLPQVQSKAMDNLNYRAYLVANLFLKKKVSSPGYDLFTMNGKVPLDAYQESKDRVFTDVIYADWALKDKAEKSVLSVYIPLPYAMAQQYLFVPGLYEKYLDRIKTKMLPVLANMNLTWNDVAGMRLVRFGHAVPLAEVGGVKDGIFERASQSIDGCIHFANQDNWGNPCFETSLGSALQVSRMIRS